MQRQQKKHFLLILPQIRYLSAYLDRYWSSNRQVSHNIALLNILEFKLIANTLQRDKTVMTYLMPEFFI